MKGKKIKYIKGKPSLATCCIVSTKERIYMIDFLGKEISVEIDPRIAGDVFHIIVSDLQEKFSEIFTRTGILEKLTEKAIIDLKKMR